MEELLEKNLHRREEQDKPMLTPSMTRRQKEGSRMSSMAESKSHTPHGPLGSSPFTVLDPGSPEKGGAEAGEGCCQDGWRNKARIQASGGPEVSRPPSQPKS